MRLAGVVGVPRPRVAAILGLGAAAAVLVIRAHSGAGWGWRTAVALLLAPIAVTAVAVLAGRLAGPRFAVGAGLVYILLPLAGSWYFYGAFTSVYDHHVMPAMVGLERTGWFALGVATALGIVILPERLAGVIGGGAAVVAAVVWIDTSWSDLFGEFHETTWSPTLLCFVAFAATLGIGLRRPWLAAAVAGPVAVLVLRGAHHPYYTVVSGSHSPRPPPRSPC